MATETNLNMMMLVLGLIVAVVAMIVLWKYYIPMNQGPKTIAAVFQFIG